MPLAGAGGCDGFTGRGDVLMQSAARERAFREAMERLARGDVELVGAPTGCLTVCESTVQASGSATEGCLTVCEAQVQAGPACGSTCEATCQTVGQVQPVGGWD